MTIDEIKSATKLSLFILSGVLIAGCITKKEPHELPPLPSHAEVEEEMKAVLEWQLQHHNKNEWNTDWLNSTLFIGVTEAGKVLDNEKYWKTAKNWAKHNNWQIQQEVFNADNQACAQVYLDIYTETKEQEILGSFRTVIDSMRKENVEGRELWYWCDSLFMAPPAIAKLGMITGNSNYFKFLNNLFWDTHDYLFDQQYNLFYRDKRFFNKKDSFGDKIFWSRGNGWVIAGIARVLENLPKSNPRYGDYKSLYKRMIDSIVELQPVDGLWRTNLLNPQEYPTPETSGTAFFSYALGWGLNKNILDKDKYKIAFIKSWEGLVSKIDSNGKLGAVQSVASKPGKVDPENSEIYAVGAFLLASTEMSIWIKNSQSP